MKIIRIYQAGQLAPGMHLTLNTEASQHIAAVLRRRVGDELIVFNGDNHEYHAVIVESDKKKSVVNIIESAIVNRESPLRIDLVQAVSKGDRMEWVVQKAVELGVHRIIPVISMRTVVKLDETRWLKKHHQWQSIARSACEQCGRNAVPEVLIPTTFRDWMDKSSAHHRIMLDPEAETPWQTIQQDKQALSLWIGPGGGFTDTELSDATQAGFIGLRLGPRILRTETAAIAALSLLQAASGGL